MLRAGETLLRRRNSSLPTNVTEHAAVDGSVRSIKLDAPLTKAIKSADGCIKGSYAWLFVSVLSIYIGSVWIFRHSAMMSLDCQGDACTFSVRVPKGYEWNGFVPVERNTKIDVKREQIVRADNIKWDPTNHVIVENYGLGSPSYINQQENKEEDSEEGAEGAVAGGRSNIPWNKQKGRNKKKKKYKKKGGRYYTRTGPDANGNYDSYTVVIRDLVPISFEEEVGAGISSDHTDEGPSKKMQRQMEARHLQMMHDPTSFASRIAPFAILGEDALEYVLHLRDFNVDKTHRLPRTTVSKINAYVNKKRSSFVLREARPVSWQGLVLIILGIFSLVLNLLLGTFWEEYDPTKVGSYKSRMTEMRKRAEANKLAMQKRRAASALRRSPQQVRNVPSLRDRPNPLSRKAY